MEQNIQIVYSSCSMMLNSTGKSSSALSISLHQSFNHICRLLGSLYAINLAKTFYIINPDKNIIIITFKHENISFQSIIKCSPVVMNVSWFVEMLLMSFNINRDMSTLRANVKRTIFYCQMF